MNAAGEAFQINEYFAANPRMMLGTMAMAGTMYRANDPALVPDGRELGAALRDAVACATAGRLSQLPDANHRVRRQAGGGDPRAGAM